MVQAGPGRPGPCGPGAVRQLRRAREASVAAPSPSSSGPARRLRGPAFGWATRPGPEKPGGDAKRLERTDTRSRFAGPDGPAHRGAHAALHTLSARPYPAAGGRRRIRLCSSNPLREGRNRDEGGTSAAAEVTSSCPAGTRRVDRIANEHRHTAAVGA